MICLQSYIIKLKRPKKRAFLIFCTFFLSKKHFPNYDGCTSKTTPELFKDVKL